jgi:hypothetical protein
MATDLPHCVYCERTSDQIPLLTLIYQGETMWICPHHMPLLIHNPDQLVGKLPGAEKLASDDEKGHHQA